MRGLFLKIIKNFLSWSTHYVVNFMNLIKFIVTWEQRMKSHNFKENTSNSPNIHLIVVVSIR